MYHHLTRLLTRFRRNQQGIAAMEFAMVAPILMVLFLGGTEFSRYLIIHQKVEKTATTIADIVAQSDSLTQAQLNQIFLAASEIMQPLSFNTEGVVIVSSVRQQGSAASPNVAWQRIGGGDLTRTSQIGTQGFAATLPAGFTLNDKENVIVAEVYYVYSPLFGEKMVATGDVYKRSVYKPRLGALTQPPA